ncbi:MAG: sigma-70 family RNA polymerase sigma factor [Holophagales bacterium]|nr:sigma-70 family RNA polymerase sigma factor [Holophagales bacterium]
MSEGETTHLDEAEQPDPALTHNVTELLLKWGDGDEAALDRLLPVMYSELRSMADRSLRRERSNHTLQATALVNEAYLRLVNQDRIQWRNRAQFLGIAAEMMRRILVDHARKRQAAKRDGGLRMTLDEGVASVPKAGSATREVNLVALDAALSRLQKVDPRQARIVELRYFAGLKVEETAEVLEISSRTVKREWQMARAWLKRELARGTDGGD